jgi:hypothetical protein
MVPEQPGTGTRWKTPHQHAMEARAPAASIELGDAGIWATCARGMEKRAAQELMTLFEDVCWPLQPDRLIVMLARVLIDLYTDCAKPLRHRNGERAVWKRC